MREESWGWVALVVLLGLAACGSAEVDPVVATPRRAVDPCPAGGCGGNAASLGDGKFFWELDLSKKHANAQGVRIVDIIGPDGYPTDLWIDDDRLAGQAVGAQPPIEYPSPESLVGTQIVLHDETDGAEITLHLLEIKKAWHWTPDEEKMPGYVFEVTAPGYQAPLCRSVVYDPEFSTLTQTAFLFAGDRYDLKARKVRAAEDDEMSWVNVACAGTVQSKLHAMRYTEAGTRYATGLPYWTIPVPERQAMMKLLSADYCNTGETFTRDGQPLTWVESHGYRFGRTSEPMLSFEAIWGPDGALCLEEPRRVTRFEVEEHCMSMGRPVPPACDGTITGTLYSINPDVPPIP